MIMRYIHICCSKLSICVVLFLCIVLLYSCFNNNHNVNTTFDLEFRSKIVSIYKDVKNHNCTFFDIKLQNGKLSNLNADNFPGSEEFANIGDSIIKDYGKISITIKKKDGNEKTFKLVW